MPSLELAIVADIHHGRDTFTKRGPRALPLLDDFLDQARRLKVEAILDLGDRISDVDRSTDLALEFEVAERFAEALTPRFHVDGNHDRAFLSAEENVAALGQGAAADAVEFGDVRLVFWRPDVTLTRDRGFSLKPGDLGRLSQLLGASSKRTILVSHAPLSGQSMAGNYWFEENPDHARYAEQNAIRSVIATAPCPVVALAGHVHWNSVTTLDHTPHLTLQSISDCWRTAPEPSGAWAHLKVEGETLSWRVAGRDPFAAEIAFPHRKGRLVERLPRFSAITEDPAERYRMLAPPPADAA